MIYCFINYICYIILLDIYTLFSIFCFVEMALRKLLTHYSSPDDRKIQIIDGIRGDGFCSIWALIIGISVIFPDKQYIFDNLPFIEPRSVRTVSDIIGVLRDITTYILSSGSDFLNDINHSVGPTLKLQKWELEYLHFQLSQDMSLINIIQGETHFKLLAFMLGVSIHVNSITDAQSFIFGDSSKPKIFIETNGAHYSLLITQDEADNIDFTTYWWKEQWNGHPLNTGDGCFFLPTLLK